MLIFNILGLFHNFYLQIYNFYTIFPLFSLKICKLLLNLGINSGVLTFILKVCKQKCRYGKQPDATHSCSTNEYVWLFSASAFWGGVKFAPSAYATKGMVYKRRTVPCRLDDTSTRDLPLISKLPQFSTEPSSNSSA